MRILLGENLKIILKKLPVNIFYNNISKFQIYFSDTFFTKLLCVIKQYLVANEKFTCKTQHKMRNLFEDVITHLKRPFDRDPLHFGMENISISLRREKQMRKIMYNRALFILHKKKRQNLTFSRCHREI